LRPEKEVILAKVFYSEQMVTDFLECAIEMGISPAMRHLEYPHSYSTAQRWFNERGIPLPTIDSLAAKAAELKIFYSDKEKLFAAQTLIDRIVEMLHGSSLDADEINKLGNALNKAIQTFNLIEGKSTSISETRSKDGSDLAVIDMLNEAKAKNALIEQQVSEHN
jgi:hypothetical protein